MIHLDKVYKNYGDFQIQDLSLEVGTGEYFVILGPSGAGKTLLLEMMAGLEVPDSGHINGLEKRRIGLIYQDYMLFPHMNVFENIAYGLTIRKEDKQKINTQVQEVSQQLGIAGLLSRNIHTLSGGEKQRVAIARAMVMRPEVYLLDEPTAALDLSTKIQIQRMILELHKKDQPTVIHVTHDFEEALAMGDRIGLLFSGQLIQNDTPEKVFNHPVSKKAANFLGYKNVFSGRIKDHLLNINGIDITTPEKQAEKAYIAVRSNDIILSKARLESSARNAFSGRVIKGIKRTNHVEMIVDIGVWLYVDITYQSFREMPLDPGSRIWVTFKTSAVKVFLH
ncbi:MAG: ATP-binding cassette domain-containing protein [Candidatus Aminicenantes bacterium]|nr:ATP-binding cassette domain-containing protein [Candidatus Aminicenantes bacterium]